MLILPPPTNLKQRNPRESLGYRVRRKLKVAWKLGLGLQQIVLLKPSGRRCQELSPRPFLQRVALKLGNHSGRKSQLKQRPAKSWKHQ